MFAAPYGSTAARTSANLSKPGESFRLPDHGFARDPKLWPDLTSNIDLDNPGIEEQTAPRRGKVGAWAGGALMQSVTSITDARA
jgi:hypothetical protein